MKSVVFVAIFIFATQIVPKAVHSAAHYSATDWQKARHD